MSELLTPDDPMANNLCGIPFHISPLVPSELPKITFDPQRKCTWASESYRAETNAWLLERFGTEAVAFFVDRSFLGFGQRGRELFISPKHAVMLKGFVP